MFIQFTKRSRPTEKVAVRVEDILRVEAICSGLYAKITIKNFDGTREQYETWERYDEIMDLIEEA